MRLPELFLLGALAACNQENTPKTDVDIAMSTQGAAVKNTLTVPETKSAKDIADDASWIVSTQYQKNSLGETNCENGVCPSVQALCTVAPNLCVEVFNCAVEHFGLGVDIGYRNVFRGLEEHLEGTEDGLRERAVSFLINECI